MYVSLTEIQYSEKQAYMYISSSNKVTIQLHIHSTILTSHQDTAMAIGTPLTCPSTQNVCLQFMLALHKVYAEVVRSLTAW